MATESVLREAGVSLERMQAFDPKTLDRASDLGRELNFSEAIPAAEKIVSLYRRIPVSILSELTDQQLNQIQSHADADYNRFNQVIGFSANQNNVVAARSSILDQITKSYDATFNALWQFIAFAVATVTDTSVLEGHARAVLQSIEDRAASLNQNLEKKNKAAQDVLDHIQKVAAEQGVSQQAHFFKERADEHATEALWWQRATVVMAVIIIVFASLSSLAFKVDWLKPSDGLDAAEFLTGKVLVFLTLGAIFALSAKNFLAHKHNSILNRHRQTSLQTYTVLVDAASSAGSQDIVLAQAAACIFGAQDTGFSKEGNDAPGSRSVLELLTKSVVSGSAAK